MLKTFIAYFWLIVYGGLLLMGLFVLCVGVAEYWEFIKHAWVWKAKPWD